MSRQGVGVGRPGWEVSRVRHSGLGARANGSGLYPKKNEKLMKSSKCFPVPRMDLPFEKDDPGYSVEN